MSIFKPAERKQVKFKMALAGPSGTGKTYSALKIAKGLVPNGRIALIDTENESASLYAGSPGIPPFCIVNFKPPFQTIKYIEYINAAVVAPFDVLIIDSISPQWAGVGGILDRKEKEQLANPRLNGFSLFAKYTPEHEAFKQAIIQSNIHVIATMRSKSDYAMEQNDKGKMAPMKLGLAPIQRDGMDYEFSTVLEMNDKHYAVVSKDRTGLFDGMHFIPNEDTGSKIREWLLNGKEADEEELRAAELKKISALGLELEFIKKESLRLFDTDQSAKLSIEQLKELVNFLSDQKKWAETTVGPADADQTWLNEV